jgi:hypothetical protein
MSRTTTTERSPRWIRPEHTVSETDDLEGGPDGR